MKSIKIPWYTTKVDKDLKLSRDNFHGTYRSKLEMWRVTVVVISFTGGVRETEDVREHLACALYTPPTVSLFLKIQFVISGWLDGGVSSVIWHTVWKCLTAFTKSRQRNFGRSSYKNLGLWKIYLLCRTVPYCQAPLNGWHLFGSLDGRL